jgi:hypothetical protein
MYRGKVRDTERECWTCAVLPPHVLKRERERERERERDREKERVVDMRRLLHILADIDHTILENEFTDLKVT